MQARVAARLVLWSVAGLWAAAMAAESWTPPTSDAFLEGIRSYPYAVTAARREQIRAGVPALKRCMPSTEVRKLLGDPSFGYLAYKAGTNGQVPSKRIWTWVLAKKAPTETELSSQVVVWFDYGEKLQMVTVQGANDIEASISRRNEACS